MTPPLVSRGFYQTVSRILAILCLCAAPAHASVLADFNGDGIADPVEFPQHPHSSIVVQLSGAPSAVLPLRDAIVSVAAVDIDHDGVMDLGALTRHRRVLIWMNRGHGNFSPMHPRAVRTPLILSGSTSARDTADADPSAAPGVANPVVEIFSATEWQLPPPANSRRIPVSSFAAASADLGRRQRDRAPPSLPPSF